MKSAISASIMCADLLELGKDLRALKDSGVAYLHCDVMDGHFVPNLMLSTAAIKAVKKAGILPLDIHLMVEQPEKMLDWFTFGSGDIVSFHLEATEKPQEVIDRIAARGGIPALAINPATPVETVLPYLPKLGMLLVMTVQPGFAGQKMTPDSLRKITQARELMDANGFAAIPLEVDGNCSFENVPRMKDAGANIFVAGTSSIFNPSMTFQQGMQRLIESLGEA